MYICIFIAKPPRTVTTSKVRDGLVDIITISFCIQEKLSLGKVSQRKYCNSWNM